MAFGLSRTIQLASTSSLAGLRPARELVADLLSGLTQTGSMLEPGRRPVRSWSAISSRAGLRPASELDSAC